MQGTMALAGSSCPARFGSFEYACEALPKGQALKVQTPLWQRQQP